MSMPDSLETRPMTTPPSALAAIRAETEALGFTMASEADLGPLLALLAASKPAGRLLELGTGTGFGTAWLLSGMDRSARLTSVEQDAALAAVAHRHLDDDPRLDLRIMDGESFLEEAASAGKFDLIFADTWPGKFTHLDIALALLAPGGLYLVDDLLPGATWPEGHGEAVESLCDKLAQWPGGRFVRIDWGSGLGLLVAAADNHADATR